MVEGEDIGLVIEATTVGKNEGAATLRAADTDVVIDG